MKNNLFSKQENSLQFQKFQTRSTLDHSLSPRNDLVSIINRIDNLIKQSRQNFILHNGVKITKINDTSLAVSARFNSIKGPIVETYWIYRESPEEIIITNSNGKYLPLTPKVCQALQMVLA